MSEKADPIVPSVLYVAEQHHPWQLAPIERLVVRYHTATTVFLDFGSIDWSVEPVAGRRGVSKQHYHVWCLPDEAAWERVQAEHVAFQAAIDALAAELRRLGRYADRLVEAGGVARAPNPLTPTVIGAPDPDVMPKNWFTTNPVPQLVRRVVISHTAKMLRCQASYNPETEVPQHQRDHVVCPTDADWERVLALHQAALAAEQGWNELLAELGSYRDALADGRYADRIVAPLVAERTEDAPEPLGAPAPQPQLEAAAPQLVMLATMAIRTDGGTQSRAELHQQTVDEYAEAMTAGARFPAVITYYDGETYWLADGFHRVAAARHLRVLVQAEVRQGTRRDAVLEACGANAHHGLRRTNADKRRAVETLLRDDEWRQWSDREIARRAGVHHELVGRLRSELGLTGGIRQSGDGRQIDTSGIGRANAARAETRDARRDAEAHDHTSSSHSAAGSAPSPIEVTPVPLTPEARDADGAWFWASKSAAHPTAHHWRARPTERGRYAAACGIEMDSLPTTGALVGHCSVCERNAARRETIPIPLPADAEIPPQEALTTDAGRVAALRGYLEQQRRAGLIHHAETADTAWRMASDIYDGDTYRSVAREIDQATSRGSHPSAPATVAPVESPSSSEGETPAPVVSIPIGVYASAVTMLSTIRTALMTNQRGLALDQALELVWVLTGADKCVSRRLLELADALVGDKLVLGSAELGDGEAAGLDDATHKALAAYRQARVG